MERPSSIGTPCKSSATRPTRPRGSPRAPLAPIPTACFEERRRRGKRYASHMTVYRASLSLVICRIADSVLLANQGRAPHLADPWDDKPLLPLEELMTTDVAA